MLANFFIPAEIVKQGLSRSRGIVAFFVVMVVFLALPCSKVKVAANKR
jgi:hypothetical protein